MRRSTRLGLALLAPVVLCLLLPDAASAHGGRFRGGGGTFKPRDPIRPRPEGAPQRPLTPTGGVPAPTTPRVSSGAGIPTTTGPLADVYWGTWWALNRWAFLPERGAALAKRRVTTVSPDRDASSRRKRANRARRALLARQHIKPFLLQQLADADKKRDKVRAAAVLALAKISADDETLELILRRAEGAAPMVEELESAALAVGLMRRTVPEERLPAASLDKARKRLLAIAGTKGRQGLRGKCFALLSLGLLADQGYATKFSEEGRMVVKGLMDLLASRRSGPDLTVAVLTALSMQPRAGIPSGLLDNLRSAIAGAKAYGRKWTPLERAHALSAYARLKGPAWVPLVLRAVSDRRTPPPVRRTARLILGSEAGDLSPEQRLEAARALLALGRSSTDPSGSGVGQIALGRVLNADLLDGNTTILSETKAADSLLKGALKTPVAVRGFYVLALGLAGRDVESEDETIGKFVTSARNTMSAGFDRPRGDGDLRSAYVIGIALLGIADARDGLLEIVADGNGGNTLRGRAAIALAAIEAADEDVLTALRAVAADASPVAPRSAAALALSILTGIPESDLLIEQLGAAKSLRQQTSAAAALGQLDDPKSLSAIIQVARARQKNEELCALAVAVLGLLGDPEDRPSLFRLSLDANYIARTDALNEAFTLL